MNKLKGWMLAVAMIIIATACNDDDDTSNSLSEADKNFMTNAAASNRAEIELGGVAASMGGSAGVKTYGQMMVDNHRKSLNELERLSGNPIPYKMSDEHKQLVTQLSALSGNKFDSVYISNQIIAHQNAVTLFETQVSSGNDQRLKDYAAMHLPDIRVHLFKADSIAGTLGF